MWECEKSTNSSVVEGGSEYLHNCVTSFVNGVLLSFCGKAVWAQHRNVYYINIEKSKKRSIKRQQKRKKISSKYFFQLAITHLETIYLLYIKLRQSNQSRAKFHLILWSNCLLINIFHPNLELDLELSWRNWLKHVPFISKWWKSIHFNQKKIELYQNWSKKVEIYWFFYYKSTFSIF